MSTPSDSARSVFLQKSVAERVGRYCSFCRIPTFGETRGRVPYFSNGQLLSKKPPLEKSLNISVSMRMLKQSSDARAKGSVQELGHAKRLNRLKNKGRLLKPCSWKEMRN